MREGLEGKEEKRKKHRHVNILYSVSAMLFGGGAGGPLKGADRVSRRGCPQEFDGSSFGKGDKGRLARKRGC